jgi:hypothetical protein
MLPAGLIEGGVYPWGIRLTRDTLVPQLLAAMA